MALDKEFNFRLIFRFFGTLLLLETVALLSAALVALLYREYDGFYFLITAGITFITGIVGVLVGLRAIPMIDRREGSLVVTLIWVVFSFFGLLPFWISGSIPSFTDAFFETISGFTTTGASILNNIEELSHCMLFWRSLTHWIGGLGIIVISLALLPVFGVSGAQLFAAESAGPTKDKIHPKINETAKRLFLIYIILTVSETILLRLGGMGWFDAVCHSFGTVATGGFSTKQASVGHWDSPYIQYVISIFMLLAGVNFSLYYFGFKNKFRKIMQNEELKYYLILLLSFSIIVTLSLLDFSTTSSFEKIEKAWREAFFNVTAAMTTTGFATADYMNWKAFTWILLLIAMITGASAGSTSGAVKMIRVVIVVKYCYYELRRIIHPNAVIPVKYNGHLVNEDVITKVLAFVILYLITIAFGIFILTLSGMPFQESIGGLITCLGGVGPGLGTVGPAGNFAAIPEFSKWFLSFIMLLGRLELFTVLVLFTPTFWRK
ncbi:MAG: TrkH family potassium uptake protein [Paludibacter sp.]|nr:TrkH family potassium uptake protein [Paludibacter sp.]MDD4199187.1 TrkH family potassium uptake protein [Paludibacter sp.]MDD4428616.1 TrkH family potassium uptake protein [Paludibacter sp.]